MIRIPGKIPITIFPSFWIVAALIGFLYSQSIVGTLIWTFVIFISVLFHELGHAITAKAFGLTPRIELVAMGGATYHQGERLSFWRKFFVILNGPLFGLLLFLIATLLLQLPQIAASQIAPILSLLQVVNLFWTIVNLIPVIPLDGGHLLRVVLEAIFGIKGFRYTLIFGATFSLAISLFFFLYQQIFMGALFFLFAFQSYDAFRKSRLISEEDRNDRFKEEMVRAEELLHHGHKTEAKKVFESLRQSSHQGMIYNMSTQYLAFLEYEEGAALSAYKLLKEVKQDLAPDAACLLHKVAFEAGDFPLVATLSAECFQAHPSVDTALRCSYAHAELGLAEPAIGWLETAVQEGLQNISEIIAHRAFDKIRNDPRFSSWAAQHGSDLDR